MSSPEPAAPGPAPLRKPTDRFVRHVATLLTGTAVSQALPVALSPILTRLYTPYDFGVLALFVSVTTVLACIANARYELAIALPASEEDALNVTALAIVIAIAYCLVLLVAIAAFHAPLVRWLGNPDIGPWLWVVPAAVLMSGLANAFTYLNIRAKSFRTVASANVQKAAATGAVQVAWGLVAPSATGLLVGQLVSFFAATRKLGEAFWRSAPRQVVSGARMRELAVRYQDFPKWSTWGILGNALSQNAVVVFVSSVFSVAALGHYSLVARVLGVPASLLGTSVGQVYLPAATEEMRATGQATRIFRETLRRLLLVGLPVFGALYFAVEPLFGLIFGREWAEAGRYAQIMMPLFFVRFVTVPLTVTTAVFEVQKISLACQCVLLTGALAGIAAGHLAGLAFEPFLQVLTWSSATAYALVLLVQYNVSRGGRVPPQADPPPAREDS